MTDAILIVGGGIAGLTAAQRVSAAGARAIVVEREAIVGGRLAAPMTKANAIGNRAEGEPVPLFDALAEDENITLLTNAQLRSLEGRPGSFEAQVTERARFVTDACTRCKLCHGVCPVVVPNEFDAGLTFRKAIYTPMIKTLPEAWAIDIDSCLNTPPNYLPCNRCVQVCDDDAIHFDQALTRTREYHAGGVVLAPGLRVESGDKYTDLGYGAHPDIVTSAELQRLLESPGPTGGFVSRPSNEEYPGSVLLVLDNPSPFAIYIVASQARQLLEQDIGRVAVLVLSPPTGEAAAETLESTAGITVSWGAAYQAEATGNGGIRISYEDLKDKTFARDEFEMIVLCVDVAPADDLQTLARAADVSLGDDGYLQTSARNGAAIESTRDGVFIAGCGGGPRNIRDSIAAANAAADAALSQLNPLLLGEKPAKADEKAAPDDELRAQIENLLYALVERQQ
jgi:heterodisulfide reductase subunit A